MSQAMSVQAQAGHKSETAGGLSGPGGKKAAQKAGGFQTLLLSLLSGLKKSQDPKNAPKEGQALRPAPGQERRLDPKQGAPGVAAKASRESPAAFLGDKEGKAAKAAAEEGRAPKKKALSEEISSNSRSHEAMAAALANNADFKAARKEEAKPQESEAKAGKAETAQAGRQKGRIDLIDARKTARKEGPGEAEGASEAVKTEKERGPGKNESQLSIDLSPKEGEKAPGADKAEEAPGRSFQARLAESLKDTYNAEIVKHSAVILRGDDSGIIRLNLKPESLGNVKVRLDLADNNITGTIIVESEAAKDAFQANLEHLAKSFIDSGFRDAQLQVSVDSGASGGSQDRRGGENSREFSRAARALDQAVPAAPSGQPGAYRARAGGLSLFAMVSSL